MLRKGLVAVVTKKNNLFHYNIGMFKYDMDKYVISQLYKKFMNEVKQFSDYVGDLSAEIIKNEWTNSINNRARLWGLSDKDGNLMRIIEYND